MKVSDQPSPANISSSRLAFLVRPAGSADIPVIMALERTIASAAHWPESAYREIFAPEAPARIAIVLEDNSHSVQGFVIARLTSGECELENIAVAPNLQRKGAGTRLMQSLVDAARARRAHSIHLEVRGSNSSARRLYEKCGFRVTGRRPKYYSNPEEDAILYSIQL